MGMVWYVVRYGVARYVVLILYSSYSWNMRVAAIDQPFRWIAGFWQMLLRERLGERTGPLRLEVAGSGVREEIICSSSIWGEGLKEVEEELQREENRCESLLATTDSRSATSYGLLRVGTCA